MKRAAFVTETFLMSTEAPEIFYNKNKQPWKTTTTTTTAASATAFDLWLTTAIFPELLWVKPLEQKYTFQKGYSRTLMDPFWCTTSARKNQRINSFKIPL